MLRRSAVAKVRRLAWLLGLIGAFSAYWVFTHQPYTQHSALIWILLPLMAILAEFIPVELSKGTVRIALTLPYVAGMAAAAGASGALVTDVAVTLAAGSFWLWGKRRHGSAMWTIINASVAAISVFVGSIGLQLAESVVGFGTARMPAVALAFMVFYSAANLSLVLLLEAATSRGRLSDNALYAFRVGAKSIAVYALVTLGVAVLVRDGLTYLVPLTIVPVWALRTGLQYQARMYEHYSETITALTQMLQRAHPYTHGHLERVARTAEEVARRLGLSRQRARLVREAAVLHDIGKIAVDEAILDKPAKLNETEMEHVRKHSQWGAQILMPVKEFNEIVPWIRHHHERPDGTGYPDRLTDVEIPLESKIIAVVDAFDAMTGTEHPDTHRSYRKPKTVEEAIAELERCSGTQFDPKVVRAFSSVVLRGIP